LEYTYLMVQAIDGRRFEFGPYGIAVTKKMGRLAGVNPVWYLDITPGHDWLTKNLDDLAEQYMRGGFKDSNLAAIFPFIEHMGSGVRGADGEPYMKEFWWEREWRKVGNFNLEGMGICLCPEDDISHFRALLDRNHYTSVHRSPLSWRRSSPDYRYSQQRST
jgi:hypothetical protein